MMRWRKREKKQIDCKEEKIRERKAVKSEMIHSGAADATDEIMPIHQQSCSSFTVVLTVTCLLLLMVPAE